MRIRVIANLHNILRREQFDAIAFGLLDDAFSKLGTCHALREAWIVIQALSDTSLPAQATALDHESIIAITRCINGRCQGGWATPYANPTLQLPPSPPLQP